MHLLFPFMVMAASSAAAGNPASGQTALMQGDCPNAASHLARKGGVWRNEPIMPQKLTELPPAETFAAVYRRDERGCIVPVKYRDIRR